MKNTYITKIETADTGGGCTVDFVHLYDGRVVGINDESICLYESMEHFFDGGCIECMSIPQNSIATIGRKFVCYWDAKDGITETQPREFFCEFNGYRPDDIAQVDDLMVGESLNLSDGISQRHYVMRVE